jgi:hypothetical protein
LRKTPENRITWRSVLIGLVLAAGLNAVTPYSEFIVGAGAVASNHFPIAAVASLVLLSLLNVALYRFRGRPWLHSRELVVIYIIAMVTSGIPSSGLLRYMLPTMTAWHYFGGIGNRWDTIFWDYVPNWVGLRDEAAVRWFWEGLPEGEPLPWGPWWLPVSRWAIFVGAMWVMMIALAALVRKQWADRERLAFPLVQFPLEVVRPGEGKPVTDFFRNRLLWIGAGAVFLVHSMNGLHQHFPAVPGIQVWWTLDSSLGDRPWSAASPFYVFVQPLAVGFGYLLPLEVAAGFWGSVLLMKVQAIVLSAIGYEGTSAWSGTISTIHRREQLGGGLVIGAILLWALRGTLADAFRKTFRRAPEVDDSGEALSYRLAVVALLGSSGIILVWVLAAGVSLPYAIGFVAAFACICVLITRIIAEAGMPLVHVTFSPLECIVLAGGARALAPRGLTALTFLDCAVGFDLRELLMPSVLNAFQLAQESGTSTRKVSRLLALALPICFMVSVIAFLAIMYGSGILQGQNAGGLQYHPYRYFTALATRLEYPEPLSEMDYISIFAGGAVVGLLYWLRLNFVWWPVHPLGFVMATTWSSVCLWFSLFLGWLSKLLIVRYMGLRGYVQFRYLFLGIIMGSVLSALFWIIVGLFTGVGGVGWGV